MTANPPNPTGSPSKINWLDVTLQICQRVISIAILALILVPAMLIFGTNERAAVAIAFTGALMAGVAGAVICFLHGIPPQERSEARALAIVATLILLATIPLMKSNAVRSRLHGMQSKVSTSE